VIPLALSPADIAVCCAAYPDARDRHYFEGGFLVPMDRAEAQRINHTLVHIMPEDRHFYSCRAFDPTARRCTIHETRPNMCRDYPWYGGAPNGVTLSPFPNCSYHADVPADCGPWLVQIRGRTAA
jgi:hypothetical protein